MRARLRVLVVEDSPIDAELLLNELVRSGFSPRATTVDSAGAMFGALGRASFDVIVCDYTLPGFSGMDALMIATEQAVDVPFIMLSGTIGEEAAVAAMKAGARDCVLKSNLGRVGLVIKRELEEAETRSRHRAAEDALHHADESRRRLLARLISAQEEERGRIAVDIHDDSIQVLTALALRLDMAAGSSRPVSREALTTAADTAREAIDRLRTLIFDLRPHILDELGLEAAVRHYADTRSTKGLVVTVSNLSGFEPDRETGMIIYRIAQEAISNVVKHAHATSLDVTISGDETALVTTIRDNGAGFARSETPRSRPGHLGLVSMSERAELAGGWCHVDSRPGNGTLVEFLIPPVATSAVPRDSAREQPIGATET
jgi:two-component system, NarL family, sensor histidine kinase UhpB